MKYYLCLNSIYDHHLHKYALIKGKMYLEKSEKGFYWTLYLINEQGNTNGVSIQEFQKVPSIIPFCWIRLKNSCI